MARGDRIVAAVAAAVALTLVAGLTATVVSQREAASRVPGSLAVEAPVDPAATPVAVAVDGAAAPAPEPVLPVEPGPAPAVDVELAPAPEPVPAPAPEPEPGASPAEPPPPAVETAPATEPAPPAEPVTAAAAPGGASEETFAREFPAHAAARQHPDDPASRHWAVLVGVNQYQGRTGNTLGSVADVQVLRAELLRRGWRDNHILVLTDGLATHDRVIRGIEWLIRSTDEDSTVVFSFSGHLRHRNGVTALWPTDNRFIWAPDVGRLFGAIPAGRVWASFQGCHAEGLRAPGLEGPGRIITYSSRVVEKSFEDPEVGHSVQGWFLFAEALRDGHGDRNGDGRVSVQDAWNWATPRVNIRTAGQQTPVIADGMNGQPFSLEVASR